MTHRDTIGSATPGAEADSAEPGCAPPPGKASVSATTMRPASATQSAAAASAIPPAMRRDPVTPEPPLARHGFTISFFATAFMFSLGQMHRTSGGVVATVFAEAFALPPALLGLVIGSMFITQGLAQIPAGVLLDRYGPRAVITGGSVLAALGCLTVAAAPNWQSLLAGRMLIGLGYAPTLMASMALLLNWVGPARVSLFTGRLLFVGMIGGVLGTAPLALAITAQDWRIVYYEIAAITVLVAVLACAVLRDHPPGQLPQARSETSLWQVVLGYKTVLQRREMWPLLVMAPFLYAPSQLLVGLWISPYLRDIHGLDLQARGYALAVMMAAMGAGALLFGQIDAKLRARSRVIRWGAGSVALWLAVLTSFGHLAAWIAIAAATLTIASSTFFVVVIAHAQSLFARSHAGRSVGMIGVMGVTGIFATQASSALLLSWFPAAGEATAALLGYQVVYGILAGIFVVLWAMAAAVRSRPEP